MPDFEQRKRRSLSDEQLYEEYLNMGRGSSSSSARKKKAKKKKSSGNAKTVTKSVSANAQASKSRNQSKSSKESDVKARAVATAKKSKTYTGNGKTRKPSQKRTAGKKASKSGKRRQGKYTLYYIFIGILVAAALSILSATVLFNISVFVVNGDTVYSDEEIISASGIEKGENLLRVNIGGGESNIVDKLVYIDSAEIHRGFPNRLTISVKPAAPVAAYTYGGKFYGVSASNRLLEIDDSQPDYPIVKGFPFDPEKIPEVGDYMEDDEEGRLALIKNICEFMQKYELKESSVIDITDVIEIKMTYDERIEIDFGASTSIENKINNASILIHEKISENERCTLDLTDPEKGVHRPIRDNAAETTAETAEPEETGAETTAAAE